MNRPLSITRYNQRIPQMRAREFTRKLSGLRLGYLTSFLLAMAILPASLSASELSASNLGDSARELAHKIAADAGPGAFAFEVTNRSSLGDKAVREVRGALEAELQVEGVHTAKTEQAIGTIEVVLSESLREYVWTAEIAIGSDEKKVAFVSLLRASAGTPFAPALPIVLKATLLFAQERSMLDAALVEMPGGSRLLVLDDSAVAIYRQSGMSGAGHWDLEASLPIAHSRTFPRDLRGRLMLRRDHLFDVYLPGAFCRSTSSATAALTLTCSDTDDPWPLTPDDGAVRAFFAASRNFFTGALSPGIGKVSNVPSFYSAAAFPRSSYTLWAFAGVDGSLHFVDGMTDQAVRDVGWGSDLAAVRSGCGMGKQLLVSGSGEAERDGLRAFEIPDRDPVLVSSTVEFDGSIVALWPQSDGNSATAIVKRKDTGWYEAYRVSVSCGN
jgi:hypothetical protein